MKKLLLLFCGTLLFSCQSHHLDTIGSMQDPTFLSSDRYHYMMQKDLDVPPGCIDPSRINPDAMCIEVYEPVCGCDGKTYPNACRAQNAGVVKFEPGECQGANQQHGH